MVSEQQLKEVLEEVTFTKRIGVIEYTLTVKNLGVDLFWGLYEKFYEEDVNETSS